MMFDTSFVLILFMVIIAVSFVAIMILTLVWQRKAIRTTTNSLRVELQESAKEQRTLEQMIIEEKIKAANSEFTRAVEQTKMALISQNELFSEQMNSVKSSLNAISENTTSRVLQDSQQQRQSVEQFMKQQADSLNNALSDVRQTLGDLETKRNEIEQSRAAEVGALKSEITNVLAVSQQLQSALTNNNRRGLWGEKIAEDILRAVGMHENIGYRKQKSFYGEEGKFRPDFTFILPDNKFLNMDVKFPLENYLKYLNAANEDDGHTAAKVFINDVKGHVKAICNKEYISPADNTLDYVLLFIPNEAVYQFILDYDFKNNSGLFDESLRSGVVLCSPLNLFAVLRVIYQAQIHYQVDKSSKELLTLLQKFEKQWDEYCKQTTSVGRKFDQIHQEFKDLMGVRTSKLDSAFDAIEKLSRSITQERVAVTLIESSTPLVSSENLTELSDSQY